MEKLSLLCGFFWLALTGCSSSSVGTCKCTNEGPQVCGKDGKTYANSCTAGCSNVQVDYYAACGKLCENDTDCAWYERICTGDCYNKATPPADPCTGPNPPAICTSGCASPDQQACFCDHQACRYGSLNSGDTCTTDSNHCKKGLLCCGFFGTTLTSDAAVSGDGGTGLNAPLQYRCTAPISQEESTVCPSPANGPK